MDLDQWAARAKVARAGRVDLKTATFIRRFIGPFVRFFFRPVLEGAEKLPAGGPFLLVANHSAGLAIAEIFSFASLYLEKVGPDRPLAGFAHPAAFSVWPVSALLEGLGAIPSTYAAAETALKDGVPLLIFPGGDYETLRPVWQAYRVDFGGRLGFLRIAKKMRVPIVPMGIRGSHFTAPILWRSRHLLPWLAVFPRFVRLKRYPLTLLDVLVAAAFFNAAALAWPWRLLLAWSWFASPFSMIPWIPWSIRMRVGDPIPPEELFGRNEGMGGIAPEEPRAGTPEEAGGDAEKAELERALELVESRVEDLVRGS